MDIQDYYRALSFAIKAHKGQKRKKSKEPYVIHPIRVGTYLLATTGNYALAIAGLLHDVIEDTKYTYSDIKDMFNKDVADLVLEVTDDLELKASLPRKQYWLKKWSEMSDDARVIKFADRLDNIRDRPTKKYVKDTLKVLNQMETPCMPFYTLKAACLEERAKLDD